MAEVLLARLLEEASIAAEVRSAGTLPWAGGSAQPEAIATVAREGLDLTRHVAQPLTADLVGWADIVLGMQQAHVLQVRDLDSAADVRLITELDSSGPRRDGIPDPMGLGADAYAEVFEEIRRVLVSFVRSRLHKV